MTVLVPVYTDAELDDIVKEVAPLTQDLPLLGSKPSSYDCAFGLLVSPTSLKPLRIVGVRLTG